MMNETVSRLMEANLLGVFNERDDKRRVAAIRSFGGTMPGAARYIPITAQNTISDTTRGLVRLANWRRRKAANVEASCMGGNLIMLASPP